MHVHKLYIEDVSIDGRNDPFLGQYITCSHTSEKAASTAVTLFLISKL